MPTATPTAVPTRFSGADAYGHVKTLASDIGSRPSGSAALQKAADYIRDRFAAMGYSARLQRYSFSNPQDRPSRLLLQQPHEAEIAARAFAQSGSGSVRGELADCGLGRPEDFPASGLEGRLALIARGDGVTFQEKVSNAVAREAVGVIVFNDRGGEFRGNLAQQSTVPVVGIAQSEGRQLQQYVSQGATVVSLEVAEHTETIQGSNVVASATEASSRKKVVIGAHYDSVAAGPGANDNASGVATMLGLADALRDNRYPFDLVFVAFGDEEVGLIGSQRYLESLSPEERSQIVAMINLDMVGVGSKMEFGGDRTLTQRALDIAARMGYSASELTIPTGTTSDHAVFLGQGIPAVFFYRADDPNYHTKLDTAEKVLPENLEAAGNVALALLQELSGS